MNVAGIQLLQAVRFIAALPMPSREFDIIGRALLLAPTRRWARLLTHWRLAYGSGPEYEACTAIEQILRGIEAAA